MVPTKLQQDALVYLFQEYLGLTSEEAARVINDGCNNGRASINSGLLRVNDLEFVDSGTRWYISSPTLQKHPRTQMRISGINERVDQIRACFRELIMD